MMRVCECVFCVFGMCLWIFFIVVNLVLFCVDVFVLCVFLFFSVKAGDDLRQEQLASQFFTLAHRILKQVFESCQMTGTLGTHSMRKTFSRRVHLNLGGDLAKTRKALGQKNIQSTIHYMSFMDSEIDEAILQQ